MIRHPFIVLALLVALAIGCSNSSPQPHACTPGYPDCPCTADGTCLQGLRCELRICVLPESDGDNESELEENADRETSVVDGDKDDDGLAEGDATPDGDSTPEGDATPDGDSDNENDVDAEALASCEQLSQDTCLCAHCAEPFAACLELQGCADLTSCLSNCTSQDCATQCEKAAPTAALNAYAQAATCYTNACGNPDGDTDSDTSATAKCHTVSSDACLCEHCAEPFAACLDFQGCTDLSNCLVDCTSQECANLCISSASAEALNAYGQVHSCYAAACTNVDGDADPTSDGDTDTDAPPTCLSKFTDCVCGNCLAQADACLGNSACTDMLACLQDCTLQECAQQCTITYSAGQTAASNFVNCSSANCSTKKKSADLFPETPEQCVAPRSDIFF